MAYRGFHRFAGNVFLATMGIGGAGLAASKSDPIDGPEVETAETMFHKASMHKTPPGWTGRVFQLRNDYPRPRIPPTAKKFPTFPLPTDPGSLAMKDAPWLKYDFKKEPERYCQVVKEYCMEGNVQNDFVLQNNKIRDWYHAPWMHYNKSGREPLNGLTSEIATPPQVIAENQKRYIQNWACGFFNSAAASVFGHVWNNPTKPDWREDISFPMGSCVFKILFTEATEQEISILKGAPRMQALIAEPGKDKNGNYDPTVMPDPRKRILDRPTDLRLLQVDFAVRDNRAPIGWIFGAFIYDGTKTRDKNPWDRLVPVGLMWGNSPNLTQLEYEKGKKPYEQWVNPHAEHLMHILKGTKIFAGWNERLNGPVDNFISSCASCHSLAQKTGEQRLTQDKKKLGKVPGTDILRPRNDKETMNWFRNIPAGEPFTPNAISGDYNLQLMIGFHNYHHWYNDTHPALKVWQGMKMVFGGENLGAKGKRNGLRESQYPNTSPYPVAGTCEY